MMKRFLVILILIPAFSFSQTFQFAFLSDTHIGVKNADEDLRRSVADINADTSLKFVIITGDITELGTDEEVFLAKEILSKLNKPLYIQTGNHDGNWSPNGARVFDAAFGPGRFAFSYNGYLFIGTNSGPYMHHKSPGQVPREDILWMDSILNHPKNKNLPLVYANHYPQDSSQRNWYEAIDRLKKKNIQLILVGHGHLNTQFVFEGIPGVMGRSNLRAADSIGGYNVVTFSNGKALFEERKPLTSRLTKWAEVDLKNHHFRTDTLLYRRPSNAINEAFPDVKTLWQYEDRYDIAAGTALYKDLVIAANTGGAVYALDQKQGKRKWTFQTKGKIFSTPAVSSHSIVVASTDSTIYCLQAGSGKLIWKYKTSKPIVASPVINGGVVYIGSSEGHFRALQVSNGKPKWTYTSVNGFVMTQPLVYAGKVYFGSWGNAFYALDAATGKPAWKWQDTSGQRMFSPAGCRPVAAGNKVFIVAPDQFMTALDAQSGAVIWRSKMPAVRVRESMGLSEDSALVYVKTTDGKLVGLSTAAGEMQPVFTTNLQLGYDVSATPITEFQHVIYVPSNSGVVNAVSRTSGEILWKQKVSNANLRSIIPLGKNRVLVSSVDGKVIFLAYQKNH